MVRLSAAGKTHRDKTGEGRGFEKSTVGWLNLREHSQSFLSSRIANRSCERIWRRRVDVVGLSDGNQRRQRITHHGQSQRGKKLVRARSEFERQRNDMPPRVAPATETTREGAHRQNGNRESAVFAITRDDGAAELIGLDASGIFHQPLFRGANRGRKFFIRSRRAKRRPAKRCRADVADAL